MDQGIGARLQAAREQRGVTPDEVAAAVGIPHEAVTDIESGEAVRHYGPGLAAAWTWAVGRHLGVAIDHELATWQPPAPGDERAGAAGEASEPPAGGAAGEASEPPAGGAAGEASEPPAGGVGVSAGEPPGGAAPEPPGNAASEPAGGAAPEPAEQPLEDDLSARQAGHPDVFDPGADREPPATPQDRGLAATSREPTVQPGWLTDFDDDPLEDFDPAAADSPAESLPGDRAARAQDPSQPRPADVDDEPAPWTAPEDDVWKPDAARGWTSTDDELGSEPTRQEPATQGDPGGPEDAPPGGEPTISTRFDTIDDAGEPEHHGPQADVPQPPPSVVGSGRPFAGDTGELPSAENISRVLAYTEGEEVPRLKARSRLRTAAALLAALVALVGAGVGVGALTAQLLDDPTAGTADGPGAQGGDTASDGSQQPGDSQGSQRSEDGDATSGDEPAGARDADQLRGDAGAAAEPGDTTVQVLNGSGDAELYADARDTLEELGYELIASGSAASAYEQTTVFVTDGFADEAAALVERDARFGNLQPNDVGLSQDVELHVIVGEQWDSSES